MSGGRVARRAAVVLALALPAAGCGGSAQQGSGDRTSASDSRWTTYVDARHGFSVRYPRTWFRASERLTPQLDDPREILSLGTYPLRTGGDRCAHFPVRALEDLGPGDAFLSIQERLDPATEHSGPRPERFVVSRAGASDGMFCVTGRRRHDHWVPFKDKGRAFYALYAVGGSASPQTHSDVERVLDSLSFDER